MKLEDLILIAAVITLGIAVPIYAYVMDGIGAAILAVIASPVTWICCWLGWIYVEGRGKPKA